MPTYEYECAACKHRFELFQSIKAAPVRKCPACGKSRAKRLLSTGAGLIFKGSGFYCTDHRNSSYKEAAKKDGPPAVKSEACVECKADPKQCKVKAEAKAKESAVGA
jgi:putative FmdB family regulatory protein